MSQLYKKMYATVVGEVDDTLQIIADAMLHQDYSHQKMTEIGMKLKNALLSAEEMYLDADED